MKSIKFLKKWQKYLITKKNLDNAIVVYRKPRQLLLKRRKAFPRLPKQCRIESKNSHTTMILFQNLTKGTLSVQFIIHRCIISPKIKKTKPTAKTSFENLRAVTGQMTTPE